MEVAFTDAITAVNELTNYIFTLKIIGPINFGTFILTIGILGSLLTMILNYKR